MKEFLQYITEANPCNINIKVIPNTKNIELVHFNKENNTLKLKLSAPPEDGKANKQMLKFLKSILPKGYKVELSKGEKSKYKIIYIYK